MCIADHDLGGTGTNLWVWSMILKLELGTSEIKAAIFFENEGLALTVRWQPYHTSVLNVENDSVCKLTAQTCDAKFPFSKRNNSR